MSRSADEPSAPNVDERQVAPNLLQAGTALIPGVALCVTIAFAGAFLSARYGGPQVLYALLLGLALSSLSSVGALAPGLRLCSRVVLRIGVALLGARISTAVLADLGAATAALVACAVVATLLGGFLLSRLLRRPLHEGIISGGAVGICGVSAALAVSTVFPPSKDIERFTLVVAAGVTLLSTVAMVLYPLLASTLSMSTVPTAVFLGGSIHDVAQVVAAGLLVSPETADGAIVVKLFRVALLVPVVLVLGLIIGHVARAGGPKRGGVPFLPAFLVAFCLLAAGSSAGVLPAPFVSMASETSRWMLVIAIAAIGIRTEPKELLRLGWLPALMLLVETALLAGIVLIGLRIAGTY
ncbi:MAG: putative sulfate exporter family transporter [Burkholderiales bacterium]|jgi:uncharacterized integral membrane protein (TIGR00698 family)|nr:putative sulfate exporter family transporter [Burkholderiales bacterium]